MGLGLGFILITLVLLFVMLINKLSCHWRNCRSTNHAILQAWSILIGSRHGSNGHSCVRSTYSILSIPSISSSSHSSMSNANSIWSLSLCSVLLMKSPLKTTCQNFSTLIDILVNDSLLILVFISILIDVLLTLLISSISELFQTFI